MKTILFAIIFLVGLFFIGYMHEVSHQQIYKIYGIESEIYLFSEFPGLITKPDIEGLQKKCNDSCKLANSIAEAFTYPLIILYILIGLGFLSILSSLEDENEEEEN